MPSYFQPGTARAPSVRTLFDRIADRYDLINDVQSAGLHRVWKRWLWMLAQPRPGEKILDLCTGTGDIAFLFADHGHDVTALDFSAEMLRVANQRKTPQQRVEFLQGDAMNPPFPDESFDVITIGYGLRNLADYGQALTETKRLLKPGGLLASFCCSHHVERDLFENVILESAYDTRKTLRRVATYAQSPDHPIIPIIPETEYLKGFAFELA